MSVRKRRCVKLLHLLMLLRNVLRAGEKYCCMTFIFFKRSGVLKEE